MPSDQQFIDFVAAFYEQLAPEMKLEARVEIRKSLISRIEKENWRVAFEKAFPGQLEKSKNMMEKYDTPEEKWRIVSNIMEI